MNIREAILRAADHIEMTPKRWDYWQTNVPSECGTPACAVGWIAYFVGGYQGKTFSQACEKVLGVTHETFWRRMTRVYCDEVMCGKSLGGLSAETIVQLLRLYADKYHPAEQPKPSAIPATVRAIFETQQTEPA